MPCNYAHYPAEWRTVIRPRILARARHCCERCGAANHSIVLSRSRTLLVDPQPYKQAAASVGFYHEPGERATVIVLTIAHLDHDTRHNHDSNLMALCQRCHLAHDARVHATNARRSRDARRGQLTLF